MYIAPLALVILGAAARLVPHPANVAPIAAIAIFSGLYLPKRIGIIATLVAMFASDLLIGLYDVRIMIAVYGSFLVSWLLARIVQKNKTFPTIVGATMVSAVVFYLTTNAAVWAFGTMYPKTIAGLLQSYTMAMPFFRNSLLGDLFFVAILVGGFEFIRSAWPAFLSSPRGEKAVKLAQ